MTGEMGKGKGERIDGRHAVITGGGRGIGAACSLALAELGANVTIMGRDRARLDSQVTRLKALGVRSQAVRCDVADRNAIAGAFGEAKKQLGDPYILVCNAGIAEGAPFTETSLDLWDRTIATNLTGTFLCMKQVVPAMLKAGAGRIVNIASLSGLKAFQTVSAYTASKHGIVGLTKVVALETAKTGVTVNAVCPAYTDTDMAQHAVETIMKSGKSEAEARKAIVNTIPRGKLITPEEVAATVAWLCTPGASGVTGQAILVAGGGGL